MLEILIAYSDKNQLKDLVDYTTDTITIKTYCENIFKERKNAFKVKGSVAAKLTPLVVIKEDNKIIKAFYKEEFEDPIKEFNNWMKNV